MEEREIHWTTALEELVASEGEKCRGLAWLNNRAEMYYSYRANAISIPVIILSTLAGTASVGSSSLFSGQTEISSIVIGLVSITTGILQTISSYFNWARKAESHRVAFLQYSKLFSVVRVEMSLPRVERKDADQLLSLIREGMERLAETTPTPPPSIIDEFNKHFKDEDKTISRPSETNGLQKISIYRVSSDAKNISIMIEDARKTQYERRTSEEGGSYQAPPSTPGSQNGVGPLRARRASSENQSHLSRQETDATEQPSRSSPELTGTNLNDVPLS
jgi:hypothetical protein